MFVFLTQKDVVLVWHDPWHPKGIILQHFRQDHRYDSCLNSDAKISNLIKNNEWSIPRLRCPLGGDITNSMSRICNVLGAGDKIVWTTSFSGKYSVASTYNKIRPSREIKQCLSRADLSSQLLHLAFSSLLYNIWIARNSNIFKKESRSVDKVPKFCSGKPPQQGTWLINTDGSLGELGGIGGVVRESPRFTDIPSRLTLEWLSNPARDELRAALDTLDKVEEAVALQIQKKNAEFEQSQRCMKRKMEDAAKGKLKRERDERQEAINVVDAKWEDVVWIEKIKRRVFEDMNELVEYGHNPKKQPCPIELMDIEDTEEAEAQSVKLFVGGCGKIGFLLGIEKEPAESDPKYAKWFSDDSTVRTWLINYMQPTIYAGYYARLRSSWEELSHYDSFIEWSASAPSENVHILPTAAEIYAKIVEKTWVFQFFAGLNPNFEYARVHLLDRTSFSTLEEAHAYYLSDQSRRSPMPPISRIPSETSVMAVRYAYLAPPDDDRPIAIRKEKRNTGKPDRYSDTIFYR
ncbi:hypothetical protein GIB67_013140 [Kingdonia uniflora]|uniref:Uncharacterized protein n=1 Tax=Kingdonia uniflora TaxID=39325 RepID=A0A7J7LPA3_9MAGN|nr:hypothetical protein GIB67_013140 [Kingdonia uniflora]